jgi:hypothetical protein
MNKAVAALDEESVVILLKALRRKATAGGDSEILYDLLHVSADYLLDIDFGGECERDELWLVTKFKAFNAEQKHEVLAGFRMVESRGRWG